MNWPKVALGEICIVDWGNTSLTKSSYVAGGEYLAVSATGGDGRIDHWEHKALTPVISAIGAQCGKLFLPEEDFTAIKNTITLTPIDYKRSQEACCPIYLYHLLSSMQLPRRGAGQPFISKGDLENFKIPLPPLEEQRRIVAILDKAQDMSRKSQLSGALASSLIESEMIRRFGRPGENQAHSRLLSLVEAGVSVIDCPHSTPKWTEEGRVCLRTSNLGKGDWIWHDTRRISDDDFQERSRRAPLEPGDIVLSREGTVGIAAIVTSDMDACMGQRLVQLKLDARHLTPEYLLAQLLYLLKPERISHAMTGSTSKHINVKDLRELKISCPPIEEQCAFVSFCKQTRKMRARIALLEKNSEILIRSIQAASFCS